MDFFHSQETLSTIEWILRAVISFFFMVIIVKVLGQRTLSQLRLLDFVIALVIGNIIAHPLSDEQLGLKGSLLTTATLVVLYLIVLFSILKWPQVRKLINNAPITVIQDGEIKGKGLKKARISIDVLLEELRKEKIEAVDKVALALWEADGKLSVFLDPQYNPVTPSNFNLATAPFDLPKIIIKEGKIIQKELQQTEKDESWVISNLDRLYQTELENVLLGTLDGKGKLKIFLR